MAPKKEKDPNAPKKNLSAYFHWLSENRERIKKANPAAKITEITKIGGSEWRNLQDKSKWEKIAAEDKKRYEKENAAYKQK